MTTETTRPQVLSLVCPTLRAELFTAEAIDNLHEVADVTWIESDERWTFARLVDAVPGIDALITTCGSPRISPDVLAGADRLRLVAIRRGRSRPIWMTTSCGR